jgi:predicted hotdog family 3-hydroxylacyl-ACP dehydratase
MLAHRQNITDFIPQRYPIVMIHNLLDAADDYATTELAVESDNVFSYEGYLSEPGMVENIAQTAAVHIGYQCHRKNLPIPIGYIAAIRDLTIFELPPVQSTIRTTVRITNKVLELTVAEGKIEQDGKLLCSCEMRIFAKTEL